MLNSPGGKDRRGRWGKDVDLSLFEFAQRVRIRLVIGEPVELLGEDHRVVKIVGEVTERLHDEGLPDRLRMKANMGSV